MGQDQPERNESPEAPRVQYGGRSSKVFNLILEYRNSKLFQFVNRHQALAMMLLVVWGMLIVGMFMWFVVSQAMRQ